MCKYLIIQFINFYIFSKKISHITEGYEVTKLRSYEVTKLQIYVAIYHILAKSKIDAAFFLIINDIFIVFTDNAINMFKRVCIIVYIINIWITRASHDIRAFRCVGILRYQISNCKYSSCNSKLLHLYR